MDGYFGCFQFLAIMNKSTKISTCRFSCGHVFNSILKRLIARLYDKSTLTFVKKQPNCLPKLFHFSFPPAVMRVPVVPHPHKPILSIFLSYIDSCVVVSHCLVCNSLVTCNVRYLFICIFTTFI